MVSATSARILLCADEPTSVDDLRLLLEKAGHTVVGQPLTQPEPDDLPAYHLVLIEGSRHPSEALQLCRRLHSLSVVKRRVGGTASCPDRYRAARCSRLRGGLCAR